MLKSKMKEKSVEECLRMIYNNEVLETSIYDIPKAEMDENASIYAYKIEE
jgi:hypothetical protein